MDTHLYHYHHTSGELLSHDRMVHIEHMDIFRLLFLEVYNDMHYLAVLLCLYLDLFHGLERQYQQQHFVYSL